MITGHEFSGSIEDVGKKVKGIKVGDRVVAEPTFFCGKCRACMRSAQNFCLNSKRLGVNTDGVFAEYAVCPSENVVILPDSVSYEEGAMAARSLPSILRVLLLGKSAAIGLG